jgi:hypothetical protein
MIIEVIECIASAIKVTKRSTERLEIFEALIQCFMSGSHSLLIVSRLFRIIFIWRCNILCAIIASIADETLSKWNEMRDTILFSENPAPLSLPCRDQ